MVDLPMKHSQNHAPGVRREAGFIMVAVLVIAGLIATLAATYAHHVIAGQRTTLATPSLIESREAVHSGADYARQALLTGQPVMGSYVGADGATTTLTVSEPSDKQRDILVQSTLPNGEGAVKLVQATFTPDPTSTPSDPDGLAHLPKVTIDSLLADSSVPKTWYSSDTVVSDTDLTGLHIIQDGVELQLSNVVLDGAVVSADTLEEDPFGSFTITEAPTLIIGGNVRIDSADFLPGIAILMPDGVVSTGYATGTVQMHGDIVAHSVAIDLPGSIQGHIQSVSTPSLDYDIDQIWSDRKPQPWTSGLSYGDTWDPSSVAVVPSYVSVGQLSNIIDYWAN
jgi:hypothetical protein